MRFEDWEEPVWTRSIRFLDTGDENIEEARDIIRQWVDLEYEKIKPKPGEVAWRSTGTLLTWPANVLTSFTGEMHPAGHTWSPARVDDKCSMCGEMGEHTKYHE